MMPRVIQPGDGSGKMRVRYTTGRKRGLVAISMRMQAEGMTLVPPRQNCVLPPPAEKLIQHPLRKTKPPRLPPAIRAHNPVHTD